MTHASIHCNSCDFTDPTALLDILAGIISMAVRALSSAALAELYRSTVVRSDVACKQASKLQRRAVGRWPTRTNAEPKERRTDAQPARSSVLLHDHAVLLCTNK